MVVIAVASGLSASVAFPLQAQTVISGQLHRAMVLLERKDYARALGLVEAELNLQPRDPVALATRGNIYVQLGRYAEALTDHDAVLQMRPQDPGALTNACWVRALADTDLDNALSFCDRAVALSRGRGFAAYDTRAFLHLRRGEFSEARADYDAAIRLSGKLASSLYGRGIAKLRAGDEASGRSDLATASRLDPRIGDTYSRRGVSP